MKIAKYNRANHKRFETETIWIWCNMLDIGKKKRFIISSEEIPTYEDYVFTEGIKELYVILTKTKKVITNNRNKNN